MRFNLLLGLILCIFSFNEMNAAAVEKDSLNPLYPDLVNAYQLKIKNLNVVRSMGKNVKLKYDVVNTGKHIVKLGKGRKIPNTMSVVFDDAIEQSDMSKYKAQIAEQILNQDLFLQSGKSATQKEVKVNLNAPAKLAHLIGSDHGARLSENTVDKIKNGVGSLSKRNRIDDNFETTMDAEEIIEDDFEEVDAYEKVEDVPAFSQYTEKVTEIDLPKPSTKTTEKVKRSKIRKPKKETTEVVKEVVTEVASDKMEYEFEEEMEVTTTRKKELPKVNEIDGQDDFGTTTTISETTNPDDDSILAALKKKRKAKRDAAKKEAMDMKASAAGSNVYNKIDTKTEAPDLSSEEWDTSENLETEKSKWYEGFKPYAGAQDFEENQDQTYVPDPDADEFLDKTTCPDLTLNDIEVVKMGKKWVTVEFTITNEGKGPARIYGKTPKEADNVYIKAFLSGSKKVSRGATTLGGMYINKGVSNKAGKLMPNDSMTMQMKIDIRKKTKFTSVLILDLDAFGNCRECDETNNKQHVVLK